MKTTGIVRRMDDLGRIIVPKHIRKALKSDYGDMFEVFVDDNGVYFKKIEQDINNPK